MPCGASVTTSSPRSHFQTAPAAEEFGLHPALLDACLHALLVETTAGDDDGGQDPRREVPFSWSGVSLHARGAAVARVRLTRHVDGSVALAIADPGGQPIMSVASLSFRPVASGSLDRDDGLWGLEWVPAVVGDGAGASHVELDGSLDSLVDVPDVVVVRVPETARDGCARTLTLLQEVAGGRGALRGLAAGLRDVGRGCSGPGTQRAGRAARETCFRLVDADDDGGSVPAGVWASEEPQLRVHDGQVLIPRLARLASSTPEEVSW